MTTHTELAAQARRLALFIGAQVLEAKAHHHDGLSEAALCLTRCAAVLESTERLAGGGEPVAFELFNPTTGHAIVDYSRQTYVGYLSEEKGYQARPLGYVNTQARAVKSGDRVPLWQAREALDDLESAARGDAPFNRAAAALIREALEQATTPPPQAERVPLSDAESLALWSGSDVATRPVLGRKKVIDFARAIERAHGITPKEGT